MRENAHRLLHPAAPVRQRGLSRAKPRTSGFKSAPVRAQIRRILRLPGTGFAGHCANAQRLVGNGTPGQAQACGDSPCGVGFAVLLPSVGLPPETPAIRTQNPQNTPIPRRCFAGHCANERRLVRNRHAGAGASLRAFSVRRRICGIVFTAQLCGIAASHPDRCRNTVIRILPLSTEGTAGQPYFVPPVERVRRKREILLTKQRNLL